MCLCCLAFVFFWGGYGLVCCKEKEETTTPKEGTPKTHTKNKQTSKHENTSNKTKTKKRKTHVRSQIQNPKTTPQT